MPIKVKTETAPTENKRCEITITDEELRNGSEGGLLAILVALYSFRHPRQQPVRAIASDLSICSATLSKAIADETHLGVETWLKICRLYDFKLYEAWLEAKRGSTLITNRGKEKDHAKVKESSR